VNGISEIVENGKTALLVSPSDPTALADGIEMLKQDKELRKKLSDSATERIIDFNIDKVVQGYSDAYLKIGEMDGWMNG